MPATRQETRDMPAENRPELDDADDAFWQFSLAFYARPGIASACLALQDAHGRDVNLALYCCWLGASGRGRLDTAGLAKAEAAIAPWRSEVIEKLRGARRAIKAAGAAHASLYAALKAVELQSEHAAQHRLAALAPPANPGAVGDSKTAVANLELYIGTDLARGVAAPLVAALINR
jgi:uncharacterized protein (TIGR02444 family)